MRDWQLTADSPLAMRLAADARLGRTDYIDDQSWEIVFGGPEEPALAIQTRYGGRVGLARLVPMWLLDGRAIYQTMGYAERPTLRLIGPNVARVTARLITNLNLTLDIWVMESHGIGGRFTLENRSDQPLTLRCELFAQVTRDAHTPEMNLLGLDDGSEALHLGRMGNINPVLLLEKSITGPQTTREAASSKLISSLTVPAQGSASVRWVHAGYISLTDSLNAAYRLLYRTDWEAERQKMVELDAKQLTIETGNPDLDVALGLSANVVLRSFIGPTGSLPYPSIVTARIPARGFSARGDGSDHGYQWNGQTAASGYLALPAMAVLAPELAKGAVRNWLAVRQPDGWIDLKPGLGGQRARMLSLPLLATTAWRVYEHTEDRAFITEVLPGLRSFFARWFQSDCDRDGDGSPEWANTAQSNYPESPTFARFRRWAQNADINKVESPDLAAFLISEGRALQKMIDLIGDTTDAEDIQTRIDGLLRSLDIMWDEKTGSYAPCDRDTDQRQVGVHVFRGRGDESFDVKTTINPPNRLILRVVGGKESAPRVSVALEGLDVKGNHVAETVPTSAFAWYYGMGAAVTEHVYSQVNYIRFEGLIRLYNVEIDTVDLTRQALPYLIPLWAGVPDAKRTERIVQTITDPERYWRPYGLPVCPANDPAFAANNDGGSGGVWLFWNTLIIEGLLNSGHLREAETLFDRILSAQLKALRRDRAFREGYNSEIGDGLGDIDELAGVVPLGLFMQMIGLRITSERRIWAGGPFAFSKPVKVTQFGVEVTRSGKGTVVKFPSGQTTEVGSDWQLIEDPTPIPAQPPAAPATPPEVAPVPAPVVIEPANDPANVDASPAPVKAPEGDLIKVDQTKDDTMEIPISKLEFRKNLQPKPPENTSEKPPEPPETPGTVKIPVRGPRKDQ